MNESTTAAATTTTTTATTTTATIFCNCCFGQTAKCCCLHCKHVAGSVAAATVAVASFYAQLNKSILCYSIVAVVAQHFYE